MQISRFFVLLALVWLFVVGQLGVQLFPLASNLSSALWFALGMVMVLFAAGRQGEEAARGSLIVLVGAAVLLWAAIGLHAQELVPLSVGWGRLGTLFLTLLYIVGLNVCIGRGLLSGKLIFAAWLLGGIAVILHLLVAWFGMESPRTHNWVWGVSPFLNIRHLAFALVPAWIGGIYFYVQARKPLGYLVMLTMLLACFFWMGGRGAGLALLVFTVPLVFVPAWRPRIGRLLFIVPAAGVLSLIFTVTSQAMGLFSMLRRSGAGGSSGSDVSSGRFQQWADLWEYFLGNPVWGHGPDGYRFLDIIRVETVQPHNGVLQLLGEFGVAGIVPIVAVVYFLIRSGVLLFRIEKWSEHPVFVIAFLGWLSYGVLTLFDGAFYHAQPLVIFATFMVLVYRSRPSTESFWLFELPSWRIPRPVLAFAVAGVLVLTVFIRGISVVADDSEPPAPDSWRVAWSMYWPLSIYNSSGWLVDWYENSPWMAELWTERMSTHYYREWEYLLLAARHQRSRGDEQAAQRLYRQSIDALPATSGSVRASVEKEMKGSALQFP